MTAAELIELLRGVDPDTEVRLAQQPSWPFEYEIGEIVCLQVGGPQEGDRITYEDDEGAEHTSTVTGATPDGVLVANDSGKELPVPFYQLVGYLELTNVLYIGEGVQLGYLPGIAARELGWR